MIIQSISLRNIKFFGIASLLFMFVMVRGNVAFANTLNDDNEELYKKGISYVYVDNDKAIEILSQVLQNNPQKMFAYYFRGLAYLGKRMNDEAIQDFTKYQKYDPGYAWAYGFRGSAYFNIGMKNKAKEDFDAFSKYVDPSDKAYPVFKSYLVKIGYLGYLKKITTVEYNIGNTTMNQLLIKGVENNDIDMVQMAVKNGANVNIYFDGNHWTTPLSRACSNNNLKMIDFLLDSDADPNVIVSGKPLILNFLSYNNERSLSLIQHLIDRGADIKAVDERGNTVFMCFLDTYSSYEYKKNLTKYFISQGVDVNYPNKDGDTPLHKASAGGYVEIVKLLLDAGADPNKFNQYSKRPLDYAINSGNKELISLLLPLTKM